MAMQALILGFGGSGAHILTYLKELAVFKYGKKPDSLRFLLFDTIADWKPGETVKIMGGRSEETIAKARTPEEGTSLDPDTEYFHLKDTQPSLHTYVNKLLTTEDASERYAHIHRWLNAAWLKKYISSDKLGIAEGAAQQRQIGRFALFQNIEYIKPALTQNLAELERHAGGATLNVWIVGSAAGGTGAGCLLDAAYLTRMAAPRRERLRISAVIVLPEVYHGIEGVSRARAYSLFRELERVQAHDCEHEDEYRVDGLPLTSDQIYDANGKHHAVVTARLFDNVFLVGRECRNDDERKEFFSSVVAAMDPYTDEMSGPTQLERSVNVDFDTVSFGGGRIYIPVKTYQELFAWQEVEKWLKRATAPRSDAGGGVHAGRPEGRKDDADRMVVSLLPMFEDLLTKVDKSREEQMAYGRTLDPKTLVTRNLQLASAAVGGMRATAAQRVDLVPLTYINPFISLREADETAVPAAERVVKTYVENQKAKGPRETQKASAERFAAEVDKAYTVYVDKTGPAESFEQGRRTVFEIIRAALITQIDAQMSLAGKPISTDLRDEGNGTAFNRLHQSLEWIITTKDGTLDRIGKVIDSYAQSLADQKNTVQRLAVDAVSALRDAQSGVFGSMRSWVEDYQLDARSRMADLVRWHQQSELLQMTRDLLQALRSRYAAWHNLLNGVLHQLVTVSIDRLPVWHKVRTQHIDRLQLRLSLLARDRTARISLAEYDQHDTAMQGFADVLRREAVLAGGEVSLAERALDGAVWDVSVAADGQPQITLRLKIEDEPITVPSKDIGQLHEYLYQRFRKRIDNAIGEKTIFDYLDYVQREKNYDWTVIVSRLNEATPILISANRQPDARFFYHRPKTVDHQRIAELLQTRLREQSGLTPGDPEDTHSDPYSLTLLKLVTPNPTEIHDLTQCAEDYLNLQVERLSGSYEMDQPIRRAQVFHIFRAEQEAWYLERQMWRSSDRVARKSEHLSPRLVRLLEYPNRVKALVDCVATGVIAFDGDSWVFHDKVRERDLIASRNKSLIRAMVVFVLQRSEDREGSLAEIDLPNAIKSATIAAKALGKKKRVVVRDFIEDGRLDAMLEEHVSVPGNDTKTQRSRTGLREIFKFYGDAEVGTELTDRLNL